MHRAATPALLASLLAVAGCRAREPIPVGFVSGLSGRHYDLGISSRNGASLAVAEINSAGGIGGRLIELVIRDDEQDPAAARRAVEELVRRGVVAIVGHATSAMAEATLPIVDRERVLMVSPTVSSSEFVGKDDWFVMLYSSAAQSSAAFAEFLARRTTIRRVTAFYDLSNRAYSENWFENFRRTFEARGGRVVEVVPFTSGKVASYASLVGEALRTPTEAVLVVASALDSAAICQQARKLSPSVRILGSEWGFTTDAVAHGGSALEGALVIQRVNLEDQSPAYLKFRDAYLERFGRPVDFAAVAAYEAVQVLASGLRRSTTREGLRRAVLETGTFQGLQGSFRVDRFGDAQRQPQVVEIRGGRMTPVE